MRARTLPDLAAGQRSREINGCVAKEIMLVSDAARKRKSRVVARQGHLEPSRRSAAACDAQSGNGAVYVATDHPEQELDCLRPLHLARPNMPAVAIPHGRSCGHQLEVPVAVQMGSSDIILVSLSTLSSCWSRSKLIGQARSTRWWLRGTCSGTSRSRASRLRAWSCAAAYS